MGRFEQLGDFRCATHPARPVQAVCTGCNRALCSECISKVDGLNRCATCLAGERLERAPRDPHAGARLRRLMVVACFAVLTALGVGYGIGRPLLEGMQQANHNERIIEDVRRALHTYRVDNDRWPTVSEGLAALLVRPDELESWDGPYLWDVELTGDNQILDGYGAPLFYWWEPDMEQAYLVSSGPDRQLDSIRLGTPDPRVGGDDVLVWTDDLSLME